MRCFDSATDSVDVNLSKLQEILEDRGAGRATVHGVAESDTTQQLNKDKNNSNDRTCWSDKTYVLS